MAIRITASTRAAATTARPISSAARASPRTRARIDAYGTVDELNAALGVVRAVQRGGIGRAPPARARARRDPARAPERAVRPRRRAGHAARRVPAGHVPDRRRARSTALEQTIDRCQEDLAPLQVVRPARRRPARARSCTSPARCAAAPSATCCALMRARGRRRPGRSRYLNRLSDLLFVLSRWIGHHPASPSTSGSARSSAKPRCAADARQREPQG